MKSACSKRLSASPDETECYLYAKRTKAESDQKIREKKEQQKLEQSIHCGSKYQTSPHELLYLSEGQNKAALERQCCDTGKKTSMREFFSYKTCSNEGLACRVSENEPSTKKWSPENGDQSPIEDDIPLKVCGQPLETELLNAPSTADTCQNLPGLNPPQVQQNNSIEKNNKRYEDNELEQNSSVTSLNRHMFQTELLSQKSVSSKKWQRYQLFQIPFLSGTSSVFSCTENKKSKFLKNVCSAEDKNYSSCNKDTTAKKDNKEKNNSMYIIQTLKLKPLKNIQPLKIPNFQFPRNSNKMNSKQSSTKFRETDCKNFEGEPSLMVSKQTHGVQKMSEIGKQKMQNDKSSVRASTVCSEFKEKNCPPINKQEHSALAEGEVSGNYFRCNSIDNECSKILAGNYFKEKLMENSEGDDDQKSNIPIYISAKNVQNEKCVCSNDLLQRRGRKSTNENAGTFYMQMSIPVTTEALEKNKLNLHCGVHDSNRHINFYEAEPKLSTKEILDFQSYVTKNITFKKNCSCIIVQDFPDKRAGCNVFRGMEMLKLKILFQKVFGWVRKWTESFHEAMPMCQDDSVTPWSHCRDTLKEQCDAQELVKSTINRNHNDKIFMCLLAVVSKHLKVEILKIILAFFFSSTNTLLTTEGKPMRGEKQSLCGRKQNQLNSCTDNSLRQTIGFLKENKTYPGFSSSKFVESIDFELHNRCQRRCLSRISGEEENTFLRGAFFHNQKSRLCKGRHVRKRHFLSRVSEMFSTDLRSVSHKNSMKKQILPAKYLILLQGSSDCSSLHKIYFCNFTKIQYLVGADVRYQSSFPAHSQLKFEKVHKKSTNQEISVNTLKQEKNKPRIMLNSSFHVVLFKALPFVLYKNKKHKTTGYRNCITSTNRVTNEVTYTMKKYWGNSFINADAKECVNSKELQMNCHDFLSKKYFSVFDTYEKIPLATDSEDFDQIPVVKQDSSIRKKLCEESAVTGSKDIQCLPVKSNDVLILSEQQKATTEEYNSLLLLDGQINKPDNCRNLDTCSPHLATKKVDNQNTYLFSENLFPTSSNIYQSVTLPLDSSSLVNREISEDGHCRNSLSADKQKTSETIPAMVQYLSMGNPAMTDTYLQLQAKETASFSLQGHEQMNKTGSSEPATLKHLEYVKEQEERNYEQMDVTNVSQCETVMNYLIMSYSEYKSKTFIAAEKDLKMPLSIMNNGCLEDIKDKYLPLESKITDEFEMKREYDLVLEELHMFHEISKENVNKLSSLETNLPNSYCELNNAEGIDENLARVSQRKICISSPNCGTTKGKHITDVIESSLHEKILNENEDQKVSKEYFISRMSSKELLHSPAEGAAYRNLYTWDPAFLPSTLFKEQSYNLQKEGGYFLSRDVIRVQPLKTCKGPIRIGLSRKARPKKLHPYLK